MPCFKRRKKRKKMPKRVITVSNDNRHHSVLITQSSLPTLAMNVPIMDSNPHRVAVEKIKDKKSKAARLRSIFFRGNKRALRRKRSFDSVASLHSVNGVTFDPEIERRRSSRSSSSRVTSYQSLGPNNTEYQRQKLVKVVVSMVLFVLLAYNVIFVSTVLIRM